MNEKNLKIQKQKFNYHTTCQYAGFPCLISAFSGASTISVELIPQFCAGRYHKPCGNHGVGNGLIFER